MRRLLATTFALSFSVAFVFVFTHHALSAAPRQEPPRVTSSVKPKFPPIARAARLERTVHVDVEIDAEGRVTTAKAAEETHPLFREAAEAAAAGWTFERADGSGARNARLTFEFRLEVERADAQEGKETPASPYHVVVRYAKVNTFSHVPPDADNLSCELHGVKLERDKVRIIYGLPMFNPEYDEAERTLFPRAQTTWGGGCVITEESPEFAEVLYCPACRAAKQQWELARPAAQD